MWVVYLGNAVDAQVVEVVTVHAAGVVSWQISVDQSEQLAIGLYVRDAAALHSDLTWLPPASPAVTGSVPERPEEAGTQWDAWWTRAVSGDLAWDSQDWTVLAASWWAPPAFDSLADAPALRAVVAKHFTEAAAWAQARKQEHIDMVLSPGHALVETTLVADLERSSGRRARPFSLQLSEIPVAGQHLWQLQPDHILISAALLRDTTEYRERLTPVVQALL